MDDIALHLVELGVATTLGIVGWLLKHEVAQNEKQMLTQKREHDKQLHDQQEQIKLLFEKHDADVNRLVDLELNLAKNHSPKQELDVRFDKLEKTLSHAFDSLGSKFDKLSSLLSDHIIDEDRRGRQ